MCAVAVLVVSPGGGLIGSVVAILLGKGGFAVCNIVIRRMSKDFAQADGVGSFGSHGSKHESPNVAGWLETPWVLKFAKAMGFLQFADLGIVFVCMCGCMFC